MIKINQLSTAGRNYLAMVEVTDDRWLIRIATLLGFIIALWVGNVQREALNADAVLYFEAAKLFAAHEWQLGFALFGWPLYSLLIAAIHSLTDLRLEAVAQILAAIFFAMAVFGFVSLIRLTGGNKSAVFFGLALFLSSTYIVGNVLPMVVRDHGYWAFLLNALVFLIKFFREGGFRYALLWQVSMVLAILFRIEGIIFLTILPFVLFKHPTLSMKLKVKRFIEAQSLNILFTIILSLTPTLTPSISAADFGRLQEIWTLADNGFNKIAAQFAEKSTLLGERVLGPLLDDYGSFGLALTLVGIIFLKIANTTGWVTIGLLCLNPLKAKSLNPDAQMILVVVAFLSLFNMALILLLSYVLSGRYVISLAIILMIFASFEFNSLFDQVRARSAKGKAHNLKKLFLCIAITILALSFLSNITPKNPSYAYEKKAVEWMKHNTPKNSSILYVDQRTRYYAGNPFITESYDPWKFIFAKIADGSISNYDFLVISVNERHPEREISLRKALSDYQVIKIFSGPGARKKIMVFSKS